MRNKFNRTKFDLFEMFKGIQITFFLYLFTASQSYLLHLIKYISNDIDDDDDYMMMTVMMNKQEKKRKELCALISGMYVYIHEH